MNLKGWIIFAILFVGVTSCKENTKNETTEKIPTETINDPLVYDSRIIAELTHVNQGLFGMLEQISAADSVGITQQYYRTIQQLDEGIQKLGALPAMNGSTNYRDAALAVMQFHRDAMDKQYKRIVEISVKKKPSYKDEEERETLYDKIRDEFGIENNVQLPKGDLQL